MAPLGSDSKILLGQTSFAVEFLVKNGVVRADDLGRRVASKTFIGIAAGNDDAIWIEQEESATGYRPGEQLKLPVARYQRVSCLAHISPRSGKPHQPYEDDLPCTPIVWRVIY